jgi:hypothetical protein
MTQHAELLTKQPQQSCSSNVAQQASRLEGRYIELSQQLVGEGKG